MADEQEAEDEIPPFRARSVENDSGLLEALHDHYRRDPHILGSGDLLLITGGKPAGRAGLLMAVLAGAGIAGGERAIQYYCIVLPPGADVVEARGRAWGGFGRGFKVLAGRDLEDPERAWFEARFAVVEAPDLRSASVIALIEAQPERTGVIVTEAALYRDETIAASVPPGASGPLAPEDIWTPQLLAFGQAAVPISKARTLYVALDANELTPIRPELRALLHTIDRFGVLGAGCEDSRDTILTKRVGQWDAWIAKGQVGLALADLETLPASFDDQKAFLRVQLLFKAGLTPQALAEIREHFLVGGKPSSETRARLALIAARANASNLSRDLLEPAIGNLEGLEELQSALRTADEINAADLAELIADRLAARFPESASLSRFRREKLLRARDFAAVARTFDAHNGDHAAFYDALATAFAVPGVPDYLELIESGSDLKQQEVFRLACVEDALARGLTPHAFDLAGTQPATEELQARWEGILLDVLERGFIDVDPEGNRAVPIDRIEDGIRALLKRQSADPMNAAVRSGLSSILRYNIAGDTGLALAAKIALDEARRPATIEKGAKLSGKNMDWLLKQKGFLDKALAWLKSEEPVVIGKLAMPVELLTIDPDDAIGAISAYLEVVPLGDAADVQSLTLFLTLGATIAPHATTPDFDLQLFRLAAGKLASSGFPQYARDYVEAAVQAGCDTPRRRRLAWFAVADTYLRTHDYLNGLLALSCTFLADDRADEEQAWQEAYAIARIMRDIGFFPMAFAAIKNARQVLASLGLTERYGHRIDLLELQTRQASHEDSDPASVAAMLEEAIRIGKAVIAEQDQSAPSAIALGQMIRVARDFGVGVPEDAETVFAELLKWAGGNLQTYVAAASAPAPSVTQIAKLAAALPVARYADDVGYDTRQLSLLARRTLAGDALLQEAEGLSFILDTLADWGAALPGWDEAAAPPHPPTIAEPLATAKAVSAQGVGVLQLGLDIDGRLVRLLTVDGEPAVAQREPEEHFSERAFKAWSAAYPWLYSYDDSPNIFYTTTEHLRISETPIMPTIVSAATPLQAFPPNILSLPDGELLGRRMPMAAVPSLAWLKGARERNWAGDGRRVAWISTAESEDGRVTMPMLAQRLEDTLVTNGFTTDFNPAVPANFAGATIAVIGAHGDIHPGNSFFQRVSDEGVLKISGDDLARALHNVGVVILFVCSGGRSDKHPGANTTLGLAKAILDRGCAAVVASPWPLDSLVPPNWLPTFLDSWTRGATLMEAVFAANRATDARFALDARNGLAMTVFGDGLLKHP